ncbi:MAG: hypothetical protein SynsKO_40010 [Synoicihabitans sp.]
MDSLDYLGHTIRRWQIGGSTFLAWPEAGARLMHWNHARVDGSIREVIHWPDLAKLDAPIAKIRGGNPVLFPFSARSFEAGEIEFWRDPQGTRHPMPMHGFARQGRFSIERLDETGFRALLQPSERDREAYPYDYEFRVTYRFSEREMICEFSLKNLGTTPIPWSAGHHFYFAAPWTDGESRDDYYIKLPATESARQNATGDLEPGPKTSRLTTLSSPDLVDTIHLGLKTNTVRFGPKDESEHVEVRLGTASVPDPDEAIVTWTASPEEPYFCVEPWMGPPNAPGHGRGLRTVPPSETGQFSVAVAIG